MTQANVFIRSEGSSDGDKETVTRQKSAIKKFHITLFQGTDSIKFDMTSEEIQDILKIKPTYFKQSQIAPIEGTVKTVECLLCKHKMSSGQTFPIFPKCGGFMVTMI
jgi:hypothetical protein